MTPRVKVRRAYVKTIYFQLLIAYERQAGRVLSAIGRPRKVEIPHQSSHSPAAQRAPMTMTAIDSPSAIEIATPTAAPRSPKRVSSAATNQPRIPAMSEIHAYPRAFVASSPNSIIHRPPPTMPSATAPPLIGYGSRNTGLGGPVGNRPEVTLICSWTCGECGQPGIGWWLGRAGQ